jgi:hypothetical protein
MITLVKLFFLFCWCMIAVLNASIGS